MITARQHCFGDNHSDSMFLSVSKLRSVCEGLTPYALAKRLIATEQIDRLSRRQGGDVHVRSPATVEDLARTPQEGSDVQQFFVQRCSVTGVVPSSVTICADSNYSFGATGTNLGSVVWGTNPAGTPSSGSGSSFTSKWAATGTKVVTASCGGTARSSNVTVVKAASIEYFDPVTGWMAAPGPIYILVGTTVQFRAVRDPVGTTWPSGRPTWGGSSGASGTGATASVEFNTLSTTPTDYKTVTATCGGIATLNVVVYAFSPTLTPKDNFPGRSTQRFGIAEEVDLGCQMNPAGLTPTQCGGIQWSKVSGVGSLFNNGFTGTALYNANTVAGGTTLALTVVTGPSRGSGALMTRTVVAPTGRLDQIPGTGLLHTQGKYQCGFMGFIYLEPKDVSFTNLEFREGYCLSVATGYLADENHMEHPVGNWIGVDNGDIATGCQVATDDVVESNLRDPPFAVGQFDWPIPWEYRRGTGAPISMQITNHSETADAAGKCTISKGGETHSRVPADPTSSYF